jgi:AraC family transcriptional regulator of adaptative response/methylated-DNA-[protein]-cysteine methyltransferase
VGMIRKATLDDIDDLVKLLKLLFDQESEFNADKKAQTKGLKRIISSKNLGDIFVVKKEKKVIAMVNVLYSFSTALGAKVATIEDMVVAKKYRKNGYGSKLLKSVLKKLKKGNIQRVTLLSDFNNIEAHKFYKKIGFKRSSMIVFRK